LRAYNVAKSLTAKARIGSYITKEIQAKGDVKQFGQPFVRMSVDANTVALWHFDGALASAAKKDNAQGNVNYDIDTEYNTPSSAAGFDSKVDGAYSLNGTNEWLLINDTGDAALHPVEGSWEGWIFLNSLPATTGMIYNDKTNGGELHVAIEIDSAGLIYAKRDGDSPSPTVANYKCITGQWYYIALTWKNNDYLRLYINGQLAETSTELLINATTGNSSEGIGFGRFIYFDYGYFPGKIDEIRISNIQRTATEISNYFDLGILDRHISAKASIVNTNSRSMLAKARVKVFNISKSTQAKARIVISHAAAIQAKARIEQSNLSKTITTKARIKKFGTSVGVTAKASILGNEAIEIISAKARIKKFGLSATAQAKAKIGGTSVATVTSKARIERSDQAKTIQAKARVKSLGNAKTIQGRARIRAFNIAKSAQARARIWAFASGYVKMRRGDQLYPLVLFTSDDFQILRSVEQSGIITLDNKDDFQTLRSQDQIGIKLLKDNRIL